MVYFKKKTKALLLVLQVAVLFSKAQNLVPNGSFETYTSCPNGNTYWPNEINQATPWYNPNTGSPDYFDNCNTNGLVGVPYNQWSYQYAHTGGAYAGIYSYGYHGSSIREYIQVQLSDSLKANKQYCVSFYVNLAINSSDNCAISEIGLLLSNNPITSSNDYYFNYTAQITSPSGFFLTDTLNWKEVSGIYTALGGERYITVGNFKNDANTDTIDCYGMQQAYYFIDDVSITDCTTKIETIINSQKISIYPNPANTYLNCKLQAASCKLQLINMLGNVVKEQQAQSTEEIIDVSNLADGVYFLQVKTSTNFYTQKVIISR